MVYYDSISVISISLLSIVIITIIITYNHYYDIISSIFTNIKYYSKYSNYSNTIYSLTFECISKIEKLK